MNFFYLFNKEILNRWEIYVKIWRLLVEAIKLAKMIFAMMGIVYTSLSIISLKMVGDTMKNNYYLVRWREALEESLSLIRNVIVTLTIFMLLGVAFIVIGIVINNIKLIIGFLFFTFLMIGMIIFTLRDLHHLKKYSIVKEMMFVKDGINIITLKNYKFHIKYDNIGFINNALGRRYSNGQIKQYKSTIVVYYNESLERCIEIWFDREIGTIFIKKYLSYCKDKGLRPCPILEGVVESTEVIWKSMKRIQQSSFCNREKVKYNNYERFEKPLPPLLLEGGNRDGRIQH